MLYSKLNYWLANNSDSEMTNITRESYLGDGVYIHWDGVDFILYTEGVLTDSLHNNGMKIILNIDTWLALTRFVKSLEDQRS